jgi:CubicO group peptidase (beta-lactamase class C family)
MRTFTPQFLVVVIFIALYPITLIHAGQAPVGPTEPTEVAAFFDEYLTAQMTANHVAGAVVAVVKDGQVLFTKGYGYADVAHNIPVDPDKTVFILGSLSKLFTWTAVMQLVEQGKFDLNADVNTYLDFQIPATYPEPITLNHLMAHNSGFEDNKFGQMEATAAQVVPLGEWLKTHIPARVRPAGQFSAYGNYGATLAGYIIERVSGLSYDDYVEKNILTPLGMAHTSSRQPIPVALSADLSQCYLFVKGVYQPQPILADVALNVAPAGSFRSTASDMAQFMIAHLNDGRYGAANILQPATAQLMHRQSFSHDQHVNGMAHGFWELNLNGQRIIGHAGSHFIFNSFLMLMPEHHLGVFIATNSRGGSTFISDNYAAFGQAFVEHYFPKERPVLTPSPDFAQRSGRFNGSFHMTYNRSDSTPEKLLAMLMSLKIQADLDGLNVAMPSGKLHFVEVEPLVFREVKSGQRLAFHADANGAITQGFYDPFPLTALIKSRWFETPGFNLTLLGLCLILFLSVLISAPIAFVVQRKCANRLPPTRLASIARLVAVLLSLLSLLLLIGVFASLFNIYGLYTGNLPLWTFIPALSIIVALLALEMIGFTALAWTQRFWGLTGCIHYTLVTLAAVGFVWFMSFWNLLGKGF